MTKLALVAALPFALSLAACGESEMDGSDTTSMEPAAVEPMPTGMSEPMTQDPAMTDGTADTTMGDATMGEDGTMTTDPMATPTPQATATPM